jgi:hypothetical protein
MKKQNQMIFGAAWFKPEQWRALKKASADREKMEETHSEWLLNANRALKELRAQGMRVEPVEIDVKELVAWCQKQGIPLNSAARSRYAAEKIREKYGSA